MVRIGRSLAAFCSVVTAALALQATDVAADQVTIRLKAGGFEVTGHLRSFDGTRYVIEDPGLGVLRFDAARFECVGAACNLRSQTPSALSGALPLRRGGAPDRFAIHGSNTIGSELMPAIIRRFATSLQATATQVTGSDPKEVKFLIADQTGREIATIDLHRHGSATAFPSLSKGVALIGLSDRAISDEEAGLFAGLNPGIRSPQREHVLGLDGLAVVVAPTSPVVSLSIDDIAKIFAGTIKDWADLGLPAGQITVYSVGAKTGTYSIFNNQILKPRNLAMRSDVKELFSNEEVSDAVARDPGAIGFTSLAYAGNARGVNLETSCGLIIRPSAFTIKTGEYPLSRRLLAYTGATALSPVASGLLRYSLSPDAQTAVRDTQFTDQAIDSLALSQQVGRVAYALNAPGEAFDLPLMRQMLEELKAARRLSTTFRFLSSSIELDTKSQQDLAKLVGYLQTPEMKQKSVLLVGFTDSIGTVPINRGLSLRRATQVRTALLAAARGAIDPRQIIASGYGSLAPVACNDTVEGRDLNRRVEVWLKDAPPLQPVAAAPLAKQLPGPARPAVKGKAR